MPDTDVSCLCKSINNSRRTDGHDGNITWRPKSKDCAQRRNAADHRLGRANSHDISAEAEQIEIPSNSE
jgi:hypothetical protein